MGVGHGRIGGPEILGTSPLAVVPLGEFAFELHRFAQQGQVFEEVGENITRVLEQSFKPN